MLGMTGESSERAYSMANIANYGGAWDFVIKEMKGGSVSSRIAALVGQKDAFTLDGPYGTAWLRKDSVRPILCIAGGAGLSPMLSILRGAIAEPMFDNRPLTLFYGGRTVDDLCDAKILEADPQLSGRVQWINAVSGDANTWSGARGYIHDVVREQVGARLIEHEIYLSGPPAMVDAVQRMLLIDYRIRSAQIHFDRFC
jgi:toluene monooxygenase electron transfer component